MSSKINALANLRHVSCPLRPYYLNLKRKNLNEFNRLQKKDIFILCDIEGSELNLFNEDEIIKYKNCRLIIETHSTKIGHSKDILPKLFSKTHHIQVIEQKGSDAFEVPEIISQSNHLDILLSKWECRTHPTPWLSLTPKNKAI